MLRLRVRNGELESEAWVYAWTGADGVVYVGGEEIEELILVLR